MSSTSCPPQLRLTIPASTTSFKRSFEQFGFDLDSPTSGGEPGPSGSRTTANSDRRDRNKRARSASSLSEDVSGRSSLSGGSSGDTSASSSAEADIFPVASSSALPRTFLAPPRIPTPVIQEIDMPDYQEDPPSAVGQASEEQDYFHSTLRFSEFDNNLSTLRSRTPSLPRSPTPPPVLPPLSLSEGTIIQVPDIEEPAAFNYRDLLGSSTHLQHGSSTQSQASSSDFEYLAPDSTFTMLDQDPPDLTFTTNPTVFESRTYVPEDAESPRLEMLRPSSPLFRDMNELRPRPASPTRSQVQNDMRSWFDSLPAPLRREPSGERFHPSLEGSSSSNRVPDSLETDWGFRLSLRSQQHRSRSPLALPTRIQRTSAVSRFGSSNSLMSESASELDRMSSHAALLDRLELDRLDHDYALDSEEDDNIHVLPRLPYDRASQRESWPESFDRAVHRRASFAFERASHSRAESILARSRRRTQAHATPVTASSTPPLTSHTQPSSPSFEPRMHSVDFFDSRSSTISDMARTIARNGRPEPTRMTSFNNGDITRHFPAPPTIPAPDLGPDAIFIPHELDGSSRQAESLQSSPTSTERSSFSALLNSYSQLSPPPPPPSQQQQQQHDSSASVNLDAFAPGPFRNTMMWQAEMRQRRAAVLSSAPARPPTLPPLSFEDTEDLEPRPPPMTGQMNRESSDNRLHFIEQRLRLNQEHRRLEPLGPSLSRHPSNALDDPNPPQRQSSTNIHSFLVSRARAEIPRVDDDDDGRLIRSLGLTRERMMRLIAGEDRTSYEQEWGRIESERELLLERERERHRASFLRLQGAEEYWHRLQRYTPRRRASPQQSAASAPLGGTRNNARYSRHSERFRPLYLDNSELFTGIPPLPRGGRRRFGMLSGFGLGDFMRDEVFDDSYESLISLGSMLGEAIPKATPSDVISGLKSALYEEWQTADGDKRCPICLDDYSSKDTVTKLNDCSHWLHKECLEQWLKSASTCPVCRNTVKGASTSTSVSATLELPRSRPQRDRRAYVPLGPLGIPNPRDYVASRDPDDDEDEDDPTSARGYYF